MFVFGDYENFKINNCILCASVSRYLASYACFYLLYQFFTLPLWAQQSWGGHAFGQSHSTIVTAIQLLNDEAEVRLQEMRRRKSPEQRWGVHHHRHKQQNVGKELEKSDGKGL